MTQEEKQLLLKDLCARLPYGVKCERLGHTKKILSICPAYVFPIVCDNGEYGASNHTLEDVKPYLRPMSSMTDDEMEDWYRQSKVDYDCEFKPEPTLSPEHCHPSIDWLNKYGFDYRGLIPMGLALEAPEGMYKTE